MMASSWTTPGSTCASLAVEEFVVVELDLRAFCCCPAIDVIVAPTGRSEVETAESSGMMSGATVEAENAAWLEGRSVRNWLNDGWDCEDMAVTV